jgi:hypothetical protein
LALCQLPVGQKDNIAISADVCDVSGAINGVDQIVDIERCTTKENIPLDRIVKKTTKRNTAHSPAALLFVMVVMWLRYLATVSVPPRLTIKNAMLEKAVAWLCTYASKK